MPMVIEQSEFYKLQEKLRQYKEKKQEREKKNLYGSVELPENIENEYKELDKREINILNKELNGFINDNISFYSGNGKKAVLEANFNKMYNILFYNKKLEDNKDEMFRHSGILTEMLLEIVNCDEYRYRRYDIDICSSNSAKKKQEIKKACEKLFLNILNRKYNILREKYNLDFKLPSREEESSSDLESSNKQEIESDKNIISKNNKVVMEEQEQININTTGNKNSVNISIDSDKNEAGGIHTTSSTENSESINEIKKTAQTFAKVESDMDNEISIQIQ